MAPDDIRIDHEFTEPVTYDNSPQKIKVIGVGGGGNNAVNHMYNMGVRSVTFIVANTDRQALDNSPVPTKVLLGPTTLRGRGAGNDPEKARAAAQESAVDIDRLLDNETDMVFITAGMGGGTGTGAAPVISKIAKEKGILTIGIVTIPFLFEGKKKIMKALDGAHEMQKYVDALLVINNERLSEIYTDYDFLNAFGKADDVLSMAAMSISEIVTADGYINCDMNDVDKTLRDGGTAIISSGYGEGENRVSKAIADALDSPLLRYTDILGSQRLLFNLYFSPKAEDAFMINETKQITDFISTIDQSVDVIWGVALDETLGNKVKFTILAAGFDVTIDEGGDEKGKVHAPATPHKKEGTEKEIADRQTTMYQMYGEKAADMDREKSEQGFIIIPPDQIDSDRYIEVLEEKAAYNRDRKIITKLKSETPPAVPVNPAPAAQQRTDGNTIDLSDVL